MGVPFYPMAGYSAAPCPHAALPPRAARCSSRSPSPAAAAGRDARPPLKPCYVTAGTQAKPQTEGFPVAADRVHAELHGRPGDRWQPVPNGGALQADAGGNAACCRTLVPAPCDQGGQRDFTVTLTEQSDAREHRDGDVEGHRARRHVKPRMAKPSEQGPLHGPRLHGGAPVYAHYVHGGKLERPSGWRASPGLRHLVGEAQQIPVRRAATGRWIVQFDQAHRYRSGTRAA